MLQFQKEGGTVQSSEGATTGADYNHEQKIIRLNPQKLSCPGEGAGSLYFELLRYQSTKEQKALDGLAKSKKLTKAEYATACEKLTHKYVLAHHKTALKAIRQKQWPQSTDLLAPYATGYDTFDKFLKVMKDTGHYNFLEQRYDDLQE